MTNYLDLKRLIRHFAPFVKQKLNPFSTFFSIAMLQKHSGSRSLLGFIKQKIITTFLTLENVLFGVFNAMNDFLILNHLILLATFYIYKCKLDIKHPSLNVFIAKIRATFQIEQKIASNNDKLDKHYKRWNKVLPCLI